MFISRRFLMQTAAAVVSAVALPARSAFAQAYPQRPVKIIVPYAAGGASDIIARLIAQHLERELGQPFIFDNRAGGASMVGTQAVATDAPNGDIIGVIDSAFVINPGLFGAKLTYDTTRDFAPISLLVTSPLLLVVHPSVAANSVKELVDLAKAQPGKINFASAGLGTAIHLAGEQFRQAADIEISHIPYRGGVPSITDLLAGQVQMTFSTVPTILQHVKERQGARAWRDRSAHRSVAGLADDGRGRTPRRGCFASVWHRRPHRTAARYCRQAERNFRGRHQERSVAEPCRRAGFCADRQYVRRVSVADRR